MDKRPFDSSGADPGKYPTGALYASKWAWLRVAVLVDVIMARTCNVIFFVR